MVYTKGLLTTTNREGSKRLIGFN